MKQLVFLICALFSLIAVAQQVNSMEILLKGGEKAQFAFDTEPKIKFSDNYLIVTSADEKLYLPMDEIERYYFFDNGYSFIDAAERSQSALLKYYNSTLYCQGFEDNDELVIVDISGRVVMVKPLHQSTTTIDISGLTNGIYIVSAGSITIKIAKQ